MNLLSLSWKNLRAKPLATLLSLLLLTLGVGIISLLLLLNRQLDDQFNRNIRGIDMVLGAKGSPLQLILSSVYHTDVPTGNISQEEANKVAQHPLVEWAIPMAYGDSYQSYRILGTTHEYIEHYKGELAEGRLWEDEMEVVLGSRVVKALGLKIGDKFFGTHGLSDNGHVHETEPYVVSGILKPSNTVLDQLLIGSMEGVWSVHEEHEEGEEHEHEEGEEHDHEEGEEHDHEEEEEHDHDHEEGEEHEHEHEAGAPSDSVDRDITSMLLHFRNPLGMVTLPRTINENTQMQVALPAIEINRLRDQLGVGVSVLQGVALAIIIISAISVFVALYNSLKDRKYELALMRSMGASRGKLFLLILLEGVLLTLIGFVLGLIVSRVGVWLLNTFVAADYHYSFDDITPLPAEGVLGLVALLIGVLAAAIPAFSAFRLNISQTLAEG